MKLDSPCGLKREAWMTEKPANRGQDLHDAFHAFSEISERLTESYRDLEERVAILTEELAAARSERLLQLAEKERLAHRLQQLLDALPGAIVVLDGNDVIREYNPGAVDLLGEPLLGEKWGDVAKKSISGLSSDGYYATLCDGRQVGISSRALGSEPGRILLLKDDTETRRLQEMLNRHQRLSAMGEMVARLAHQIRTPLTSAMLYVSHLNKPQSDMPTKSHYADKILLGLRQLERMVNDMLVFARGGEFTAETVSIDALLEDLKQVLDPQLQQYAGKISIINTAAGRMVEGSRDMLLGALLNLSTNAMQACGEGVDLKIEISPADGDAIEILISDNGPGIEADVQKKIFEPFFTTRSGGTGLGLAVVRAVIQGHQGDIHVQSSPGQGATFFLRLPVMQDDAALSSGLWRNSPLYAEDSPGKPSRIAECQ
jgi:two-component system sensor histidine kinase FlrB